MKESNLKNWRSILNKQQYILEKGSKKGSNTFLKVPHLPTTWKKHYLTQNFHLFAKVDHTFSFCIWYEEIHLKHPVFRSIVWAFQKFNNECRSTMTFLCFTFCKHINDSKTSSINWKKQILCKPQQIALKIVIYFYN